MENIWFLSQNPKTLLSQLGRAFVALILLLLLLLCYMLISDNYNKAINELKYESINISNTLISLQKSLTNDLYETVYSDFFRQSIKDNNYKDTIVSLDNVKLNYNIDNIIYANTYNGVLFSYKEQKINSNLPSSKFSIDNDLGKIIYKLPLINNNYTEGYVYLVWDKAVLLDYINRSPNKNLIIATDSVGDILYSKAEFMGLNTKDVILSKNEKGVNLFKVTLVDQGAYFLYQTYNSDFDIYVYNLKNAFEVYGYIYIIFSFVSFGLIYAFYKFIKHNFKENISRPLDKLSVYLNQLAKGNCSMPITLSQFEDIEQSLKSVTFQINELLFSAEQIKQKVNDLRIEEDFWNDNLFGSYYYIYQNLTGIADGFSNFTNKFNMPILLIDNKYNITYANSSASEMVKKSSSRLINKNFYIFFDMEDCSVSKSAIKKAFLTKKTSSSRTQLYIGEKILDVQYTAIPILENDIMKGAIVYIIDYKNLSSYDDQYDYIYKLEEKRTQKLITSLDRYSHVKRV